MKLIKGKFKNKKKKQTKVAVGNLYDLNKNLIKKTVLPMSEEELANKKQIILDLLSNIPHEYMMLLCHDRRDYTIFQIDNNIEDCVNILIDECCKNRGQVCSIEKTEDGQAIEIWLNIEDEAFCYYFFSYSEAVIKC